ncbi:MAG TPA: oligosaccharide flippase family protein [Anaerolineae bacterium]|nr:oligosaccharide flippase family protein [Anaerolineae bacterium]
MTLTRLIQSKFNRDVLWNLGSLGILSVGGILVNALILRFRGAEALGVFNQVYAIYIVASQVGVGGLQFSVLKYISHNQDDLPKCAAITTAAVILVTLISGAVGLAGYALKDWAGVWLQSPDVAQGLTLALPGLLFFSLNKALIMTLNGLRHMRAYAIFKALRYLFILGGILGIIALSLPGAMLPLALTCAEAFLLAGLLMYINLRLFKIRWTAEVRQWFAPHIDFGLKGVLSGVLTELDTRVDVLMLGYFSNDAVVGLYSFAATLAEGLAQIPLVLRQNVDPLLGQYFAAGEKDNISALARRIKKQFYPLMIGVGLSAVLIYPALFKLSSSENGLAQSWRVFAIIMVGIVINSGYRPFLGIMLQGGRPEMNTLFVGILVVSNILLNALLIFFWGMYGAAVVNVLLYSLEALLLIACARRIFDVHL